MARKIILALEQSNIFDRIDRIIPYAASVIGAYFVVYYLIATIL